MLHWLLFYACALRSRSLRRPQRAPGRRRCKRSMRCVYRLWSLDQRNHIRIARAILQLLNTLVISFDRHEKIPPRHHKKSFLSLNEGLNEGCWRIFLRSCHKLGNLVWLILEAGRCVTDNSAAKSNRATTVTCWETFSCNLGTARSSYCTGSLRCSKLWSETGFRRNRDGVCVALLIQMNWNNGFKQRVLFGGRKNEKIGIT